MTAQDILVHDHRGGCLIVSFFFAISGYFVEVRPPTLAKRSTGSFLKEYMLRRDYCRWENSQIGSFYEECRSALDFRLHQQGMFPKDYLKWWNGSIDTLVLYYYL